MTMNTLGYAAQSASSPLAPFSFNRREPLANDVVIDILYCGVCHSDLHQARRRVGRVPASRWCPATRSSAASRAVGAQVTRFNVGDLAGVGCMVDSCRDCAPLPRRASSSICEKGLAVTYNGTRDGPEDADVRRLLDAESSSTERFVLEDPRTGSTRRARRRCSARASRPTRRSATGVQEHGQHASASSASAGSATWRVKLARAMGAEVTLPSPRPRAKEADALASARTSSSSRRMQRRSTGARRPLRPHHRHRLGAARLNAYLGLLQRDGTHGARRRARPSRIPVAAFSLIFGRKRLAGSLIGGIAETQEMLDFCAEHGDRLRRRDHPHAEVERGLRAHAARATCATAS